MITQWYKEKENVVKENRRGNEGMEKTVDRERSGDVKRKVHDYSLLPQTQCFLSFLTTLHFVLRTFYSEGFLHRFPSIQKVLVSGSYFRN